MLGPLLPVPQLPSWGTGLAEELLLCLWLFCQVFTHGLVTATPSWSQSHHSWVSLLPSRTGVESHIPCLQCQYPRVTHPIGATLQSLQPSRALSLSSHTERWHSCS